PRAAGAATEVLPLPLPYPPQVYRDKGAEAARSRNVAGFNYPSDVEAGMGAGKKGAALVIERGKADGADAKWTGTVPSEPGKWNGTNPILPMAGTWKPWVLASVSEFRPGPPLAYDSPEKKAELDEIKNFKRTPITNNTASF